MNLKTWKAAFPYTAAVMLGYLFLGAAFGIFLSTKGYGVGWAAAMSIFIYAGSMQFVTAELLVGAFQPFSAVLMTLMVNARHLFYGLSMIERFRGSGKKRLYQIFSLSDETYSLICSLHAPKGVNEQDFLFVISFLNQLYWVIGTILGSLAGKLLPFDTTGIDFAMTALFLVIFVEQWETAADHRPALLGIFVTLLALVIFGTDWFILVSMAGILIGLGGFYRKNGGEK